MHNNYFFLKKVIEEVREQIIGKELLTCFSQNKDELLLGFADDKDEFWIRAYLENFFCSISFPQEFAKAKRNVANLFQQFIGVKVTGVIMHKYDRSFTIELEEERKLLFQCYGRRSNVTAYTHDYLTYAFKSGYEVPDNLNLMVLHQPELSFEAYERAEPYHYLSVLGKNILAQLEQKGVFELEKPLQWKVIRQLLDDREESSEVYITTGNKPIMYLLPPEDSNVKYLSFQSAIEGANVFFQKYISWYFLERHKSKLITEHEKKIRKSNKYILENQKKFIELESQFSYQKIADILMANLHAIPKAAKKVELDNFYEGGKITIKLNPHLSPQKNAEHLYRKSKNQHKELSSLKENIEAKQVLVAQLQDELIDIKTLKDTKELKKYMKVQKKAPQPQEIDQFKHIEYKGFQIVIGRNARNNDLLTLKYARKEDYWLHAKDVSGSHVVIKHQAGKKIPDVVIEKAASIAAWYSKRKTDTLCPVTVTQKKYVRKMKGTPAGAVIVEKESSVLVEPAPEK